MNSWACLFVAISYDGVNNRPLANRYYIYAFANTEEKKLRARQLYNLEHGLDTDAGNYEKAMDLVIKNLIYPGRSIDALQQIYALDKENSYLSFLVKREINKLEDWLVSSIYLYSIEAPAECLRTQYSSPTTGDYRYNDMNKSTDEAYLKAFKQFVIEVEKQVKNKDDKDFYNMALAHLCLLNEEGLEGQKHLAKVSSDANPSILYQKQIEEIWLSIHTDDISSDAFKKNYVERIERLETTKPENLPVYKNESWRGVENEDLVSRIIYTMHLSLASEYKKRNDIVHYVLLKNKSDMYRNQAMEGIPDEASGKRDSLTYWSYGSFYYQKIKYLDYYASTTDVDKYIALIEKHNKTAFEKYICDQPFNPTDAYRDLKGTIAFRNGDFALAHQTFASMDQSFWDTNYEFKNYLNEDPFLPKGLKSGKKRNFTYPFNKTQFTKELSDLEKAAHSKDKEKAAEANLKLGHALYNTSYWGNAWMMTSYGSSVGETYYLDHSFECLPQWQSDYFTLDKVVKYYEAAYTLSKNPETKAYASLMLAGTLNNRYLCTTQLASDSIQSRKYAKIYNEKYRYKTAYDKQNECFSYQNFID